MPKKILGIYYEKSGISIAEAKGNGLLAYSQILYSEINSEDAKVSEDVRVVAAFQKQLRLGKFSTKDAVLSIPSEDLIIRFIDLPKIPKREMPSTINFEIRKYIPFKIEELVFNFFAHLDKESNKLSCLFVGIKKETLERYSFIISQAGLELLNIEPSFLSVLRLLSINKKKAPSLGNSAIVDLGAVAEEANITFLKNGFPEFSRELKVVIPQESGELTDEVFALRLTNETRISLDYFRRRFPGSAVDKITFFSQPENKKFTEGMAGDLGVSIDFISMQDVFNANVKFAGSLAKAFGASLRNTVKSQYSIDLLARRKAAPSELTKVAVEIKTVPVRKEGVILGVVLGALILGGMFFYYKSQFDQLQSKIAAIRSERLQLKTIDTGLPSSELNARNDSLRSKLDNLKEKIEKRRYITLALSGISLALPDGIWLNGIQESGGKLTIKGAAYLADEEREMDAVNSFLRGLKENSGFSRSYPNISLGSITRTKLDNFEVASFQVNCQ